MLSKTAFSVRQDFFLSLHITVCDDRYACCIYKKSNAVNAHFYYSVFNSVFVRKQYAAFHPGGFYS